MKLRSFALGSITLSILVAACGSGVETGSGASGGQGSGASGGGSSTGGASTSSSSSGTTGCTDGTQQCTGGVHQVCQGGVFVDQACGTGEGCDPKTGACAVCACTPGANGACVDGTTIQVCNTDCFGYTNTPCPGAQLCVNGACIDKICEPGTPKCVDENTYEVCNALGTGYDPGGSCGAKEQCKGAGGCRSLCEIVAQSPSSVGCSFFALNMDNFNEANPDAVIVGNTSSTLTAVVNIYSSPGGVETLLQGNVQIPPLGQHTFTLPNGSSDVIESVSMLRTGGSFRIESDLPVIAYQHSPLQPQATNDASCLLPEATLGKNYLVGSYLDALGAYPSYFNVIATQNNTMVTFTVPKATAGGSGVPALSAGQTATVTLNRYDTLQVVAVNPKGDVMGTQIVASAPVAVFGAVECAQVPDGATYCDHLEEQMIPTRNWGKTYVGAHAPTRSGSENYYWRVMAAEDNTTINTNPAQPGFPKTLNKGQWYEFSTKQSFLFTGDKQFAAFQYISGQNASSAGTGDPAMMTAVPVEQFLNRYVVLTPSGYTADYLQIIRTTTDDVTVDGNVVPANAYYTVGAYTVADYKVSAGTHVITSPSPFGLMGIGYTDVTSYGYPGGLALNNFAPE